MKTKEEIAKSNGITFGLANSREQCLKSTQEYSDQLKKDLEEKDNALKYCHKRMAEAYKEIENLQSQLSEKDKELSELKAKYRRDVVKAYRNGRIDESVNTETTAEQYYEQTAPKSLSQSTEQPKSDPQDMGLIQ